MLGGLYSFHRSVIFCAFLVLCNAEELDPFSLSILRADTKDLDDSDEYVCESSSTSMEGAGASLTCADEDGSISQLRGLLTAH